VFFFCFVSANVMHVPRLQDNGQACPICREFYVDAFSTLCGHTFCFRCITRHLQHTGACPCCRQLLSSETLFPNLALDKLLHGLPKTYQVPPSAEASESSFHHSGLDHKGIPRELAEAAMGLPLEQLTPLLRIITDQHDRYMRDDSFISKAVLRDFLSRSWQLKKTTIDQLETEIHSIIADMSWVQNQSRSLEGGSAPPVRAGGAAPPFSFSAPAADNGDRKTVEAGNILPEHENAAKNGSIVRSNTSASMVAEMLSMWGIDQSVPQAHGKVEMKKKMLADQVDFQDVAIEKRRRAPDANESSCLDSQRGPDGGGRTAINNSEAIEPVFIAGVGKQSVDLAREVRDRMKQLRAHRSGTFHDRFTPPVCAPSFERAQQSPSVHSYADSRRRSILTQLSGLQNIYTQLRCNNIDDYQVHLHGTQTANSSETQGPALEQFSRTLSNFTIFDRLLVAGQFRQSGMRATTPSNAIISSIEFDVDGACFATAGVSKRIQIFDFRDVCGGVEYMGRPIHTMSSPSKISCLSYSKHTRNHIASSDYGGLIAVWDIEHNSVVAEFEEHGKRAWTVDYCRTNSKLLASGSDDGRVKIWSVEQEASVLDIDVRANVCCVQYGPRSAHQLAVGCADHNVHIFDLRKPSEALVALSAHRKAVSYVRFLESGNELVSASTDSTLCIWNTREVIGGSTRVDESYPRDNFLTRPSRILDGHSNDKNFVGLSVGAGDLIACGSETNEVFLYHKSCSQPLLSHKFSGDQQFLMHKQNACADGVPAQKNCAPSSSDSRQRATGQIRSNRVAQPRSVGRAMNESSSLHEHSQSKFISATCWRGKEHVLLAANSDGVIRVLQLME